MTSLQKFNYDEFVRGFRAACAEHGIDPAAGANRYQVVNAVVERRRAARASRSGVPQRRWWQNPDIWLHCPPYHSETEQKAIWNVFMQAHGASERGLCLQRRVLLGDFSTRLRAQGGK